MFSLLAILWLSIFLLWDSIFFTVISTHHVLILLWISIFRIIKLLFQFFVTLLCRVADFLLCGRFFFFYFRWWFLLLVSRWILLIAVWILIGLLHLFFLLLLRFIRYRRSRNRTNWRCSTIVVRVLISVSW